MSFIDRISYVPKSSLGILSHDYKEDAPPRTHRVWKNFFEGAVLHFERNAFSVFDVIELCIAASALVEIFFPCSPCI